MQMILFMVLILFDNSLYAGKEPSDEEVEQLVGDVEKYTLANHIFWGLWGLISVIIIIIHHYQCVQGKLIVWSL